jgi:hypothetical protein
MRKQDQAGDGNNPKSGATHLNDTYQSIQRGIGGEELKSRKMVIL